VKETQLNLIELTRQAALKFLNKGQYELAIPAALQTLKVSIDVYGLNALELVTAYLLLGESSIGLGKHSQAETYLSSAKWAVIKNPACPNHIRAHLHRNFGKLYKAMGSHDVALQHFANDVYYSSLDGAPYCFAACGGYFQLGSVFMAKGSNEQGLSMFEMTVQVCLESLQKAIEVQEMVENDDTLNIPPPSLSVQSKPNQQQQQQQHSQPQQQAPQQNVLTEAQQAECIQMLNVIAQAREQLQGSMSAGYAETQLGLGMCHLLANEHNRAEMILSRAYEVLSDAAGPVDPRTTLALRLMDIAAMKATPTHLKSTSNSTRVSTNNL
jgi:tetratricopeptide (TPR) repeat protein